MKKLLLLFLLMPLTLVVSAESVEIDGILYKLTPKAKVAEVTGCTKSGSIIIPSSVEYESTTYHVTSIGGLSFDGLGVTSVTIPNSITSIGDEAFRDCHNLTSVILPDNNCNYGTFIFHGCTSLTSVVIPNSVESIPLGMFWNCIGLSSITLPNNLTGIGSYAFMGCTSLVSFVIPNNVTYISEHAFIDCEKLTSITIGSSVNSIDGFGGGAFKGCTELLDVYCLATNPPSAEGAFEYQQYMNLHVPSGSLDAYQAVEPWKSFGSFTEIDKIDDPDPVPTTVDITIGSNGISTFCSSYALDFSATSDVKAYIASAFTPSTGNLVLTRVNKDLPAKTGLVLIGNTGTFSVPVGTGETYVSNMLKGVTQETVLYKESGSYTNYILAKKNGVVGFYAVQDGSTLAAGKAYLPLPTSSLSSVASSRMNIIFDDGEDVETTGIQNQYSTPKDETQVYTLSGQRRNGVQKGIYIVNGKKYVK